MPHLTLAEYVFNLAQSALQCVIVFLIFRRKLFRSFPAFTVYLIFAVIKTIVLHIELALPVSLLTYAHSYYPLTLSAMGLELWVIYEVFKRVLEPYQALRRSWWLIFLISVVALVLVDVLWIAHQQLAWAILDLMRSISVIAVGLLLVIFALSRLIGLRWRSYCFGVALGLGINAVLDIVDAEMRRHYGLTAGGVVDTRVWDILNNIHSFAYADTILIWAWYFLQKPEVANPVWVVPNSNIERWNDVLEQMLVRMARLFTRNRGKVPA